MEDRVEQGGWIVKSGSDYSFVAWPSSLKMTPCGIDGTIDLNDIPANLVGYIHTHPFFSGENTISVCEEAKEDPIYANSPSGDDKDFHFELCRILDNPQLKGYIIDGNGIMTYDLNFNIFDTYNTKNRCGY